MLVSVLRAAPLTASDRTCGRLAAPVLLPESDTSISETAGNAKSSSGGAVSTRPRPAVGCRAAPVQTVVTQRTGQFSHPDKGPGHPGHFPAHLTALVDAGLPAIDERQDLDELRAAVLSSCAIFRVNITDSSAFMRVIGSSPVTVGGGRGQRRGVRPATGFPGVLYAGIRAVFPTLARLADAGPCQEEAR
jgi:hypothetical protein